MSESAAEIIHANSYGLPVCGSEGGRLANQGESATCFQCTGEHILHAKDTYGLPVCRDARGRLAKDDEAPTCDKCFLEFTVATVHPAPVPMCLKCGERPAAQRRVRISPGLRVTETAALCVTCLRTDFDEWPRPQVHAKGHRGRLPESDNPSLDGARGKEDR